VLLKQNSGAVCSFLIGVYLAKGSDVSEELRITSRIFVTPAVSAIGKPVNDFEAGYKSKARRAIKRRERPPDTLVWWPLPSFLRCEE
jgi:hypothetical protein